MGALGDATRLGRQLSLMPFCPAERHSLARLALSGTSAVASRSACNRISGRPGMPRKTNYDFERREREKHKAAEAAKKAQAKADKKASERIFSDFNPTPGV